MWYAKGVGTVEANTVRFEVSPERLGTPEHPFSLQMYFRDLVDHHTPEELRDLYGVHRAELEGEDHMSIVVEPEKLGALLGDLSLYIIYGWDPENAGTH